MIAISAPLNLLSIIVCDNCPLVIYSKNFSFLIGYLHYLVLVTSLHKFSWLQLPDVKILNPPIKAFFLNRYCSVVYLLFSTWQPCAHTFSLYYEKSAYELKTLANM